MTDDPDRPMAEGDEVPPGTEGAAEMICAECQGTGQLNGKPCRFCNGSGVMTLRPEDPAERGPPA